MGAREEFYTFSSDRVGDKVWMEILSGGVRSNDNLYVHFVGILIGPDDSDEEDNEVP